MNNISKTTLLKMPQDGFDQSQYKQKKLSDNELRVDTDPEPWFDSQRLVSISK